MTSDCLFCRVVAGDETAHLVLDGVDAVAFLDHRPLFPGHVLVIPRVHVPTLLELDDVEPYFRAVRGVAAAVTRAMDAEGTFVAMNNVVSQSVPHLHTHVVPRRRKDGLRGFFWPRTTYPSDDRAATVAARVRECVIL